MTRVSRKYETCTRCVDRLNPQITVDEFGRGKRTMRKVLTFLAYLFIGAFIVGISILKPNYNWDMVAYVACAKSFDLSDSRRVHEFVYTQLKESVPEKNYYSLARGSDYRTTLSSNHESFRQQLSFYEIRVLYNFSVYLLSKAGANVYFSTYAVSAISVFIGLLLLYFAFREQIAQDALLLIPPVSGLAFGLLSIGNLSSPDGMAFLSVSLITFSHIRNIRPLIPIVFCIAVGVRTDLVLFFSAITAFCFLLKHPHRWYCAAGLALSVPVYLAVNHFFGNLGWKVVFYHTFIEHLPLPQSFASEVSIKDYFHVLIRSIPSLFTNQAFVFYLVVCALSWFLIKSLDSEKRKLLLRRHREIHILTASSATYIVSHFLLFPMISERFFVGQYLISIFAMMCILNETKLILGNSFPAQDFDK